MKTQPAPTIPGDTEAERFNFSVRKMFTVSKAELERREAAWQKLQGKRVQTKKS